jgi:hypothetical protein
MIFPAAVLAMSSVTVLPPEAARFELATVLRAVGEESMEHWPDKGRLFRFLWIPPFPSMRVFSVRVQDLGDGPILVARSAEWTYDKSLGIVPGIADPPFERKLSQAEWDDLAEMRLAGFWKFHPQAYPQPYHDGVVWVLEGAAGGERLRVV